MYILMYSAEQLQNNKNKQQRQMKKNDIIKSYILYNKSQSKNISQYLQGYVDKMKSDNNPPFEPFRTQITKKSKAEPSPKSKFKKSLTDWRGLLSLNKTKNNIKIKCQVTKNQSEILENAEEMAFRFNKKVQEQKNQRVCCSAQTCRKVQSLFSGRNKKKMPVSLFQNQLTPFSLLQNIYQSQISNFDENKKLQTTTVKSFYLSKTEDVDNLQFYKQIEAQSAKIDNKFDKKTLLSNKFKQLNPTNLFQKQFNFTARSKLGLKDNNEDAKTFLSRIMLAGQHYRHECNTARIKSRSVMKEEYFK